MKLHFLGTTGYHPNNLRHTACVMLPELGIVFDAGTGFFRVRDLLQTPTLDIFLSHVHLDHAIGLTFLYDVLLDKELERVTVHLADDKVETVKQHLYSEKLFPVTPNFEISAFSGSANISICGSADVSVCPIEHPGGCHAFRLETADTTMAYVTDTTAAPDADYVSFIRDVETLVHECYFPDGWEEKAALTGHSCLTPVAQVAAKANAGRCYLVHVNPLDETEHPLDLESVNSIYSQLSVAKDGQIVEL